MPKPSLSDIEKSFCTLLTNRKTRKDFLAGNNPASLDLPAIAADFDPQAIALYSGLLKIGYHDVINSIYPGCACLIGGQWDEVVDDYFEKFPPGHYRLNKIAERFAQYVTIYGGTWLTKFPFLAELADYEWIELEVMEDQRQIAESSYVTLSSAEQFVSLRPVANPTLVLPTYAYPIPRIVDLIEADESALANIEVSKTIVAIYRQPGTHQCKFLELGEVASIVISESLSGKSSYKDLLEKQVFLSGGSDPQTAVVQFLELVEKLQLLGLFVGSAPMQG